MDWSQDFREDDILEIKCNGKFSNTAFLQLFAQVTSNPLWKPGMHILADFRDVDFNEVQFADVMASVDLHAQFNKLIGSSKIAVIHSSENGLRLGKIYEEAAKLFFKSIINTFNNYDAAVEWVHLYE